MDQDSSLFVFDSLNGMESVYNAAKTRGIGRSYSISKRRAEKACQGCRQRKVRCDVDKTEDSQCTNCRLDGNSCVVLKRKKRIQRNNIEASLSNARNVAAQELERVERLLYYKETERIDHVSVPISIFVDDRDSWFPEYIQEIPSRLAAEDINYLQAKGALSIPGKRLRDALLLSFALYVHPTLPVLDLHSLLRIVDKSSKRVGQVSLLVFQAVMFAASSHIDMKYLQEVGFQTRREAKANFYERVRILYDIDYEDDKIVTIQSLLLMSGWYGVMGDRKGTWHWIGVALSVAQSLGLDRRSEYNKLPEESKKLRRRLWWSCIMRDREVGMSMGKPLQLKDGEHDVPLLTLEDFDFGSRSADYSSFSSNKWRDAWSPEVQRDLAALCVAKAKLCVCIGHVLVAQYYQPTAGGSSENEISDRGVGVMLLPKIAGESDNLAKCDMELTRWLNSFLSLDRCQGVPAANLESGQSPVIVYRSFLRMQHLATISVLHRHRAFFGISSRLANGFELVDRSRRRVFQATDGIAHIAQKLCQMDLSRFLPPAAANIMLCASTALLMKIKTQEGPTRDSTVLDIFNCCKILRIISQYHAGADSAMFLIKATAERLNIEIELDSIPRPDITSLSLGLQHMEPNSLLADLSQLFEVEHSMSLARAIQVDEFAADKLSTEITGDQRFSDSYIPVPDPYDDVKEDEQINRVLSSCLYFSSSSASPSSEHESHLPQSPRIELSASDRLEFITSSDWSWLEEAIGQDVI